METTLKVAVRGDGRSLRPPRLTRLAMLGWLFTIFNSVRVFAYVPTLWAIHSSGDSSQHSMATWAIWVGANATMAAWLYENNERRLNRAIAVNIGNALMCLATLVLIALYRF